MKSTLKKENLKKIQTKVAKAGLEEMSVQTLILPVIQKCKLKQ